VGTEIERKFLVDANMVDELFEKDHFYSYLIRQGYIMEDEEEKKVTRVRTTESFDHNGIRHDKAYLTIKHQADHIAISRTEFEYEIPHLDGENMLLHLCGPVLTKKRTVVPYRGKNINMTLAEIISLKWEIDRFVGDKWNGLTIAEIELPRPDIELTLPKWITDDVTEDPQYLNSNLIKSINT